MRHAMSLMSSFARAPRSNCNAVVLPQAAVSMRGVKPSAEVWFTSAPWLTAKRKHAEALFHALKCGSVQWGRDVSPRAA